MVEVLFASFDQGNKQRIDKLWSIDSEDGVDSFENNKLEEVDGWNKLNSLLSIGEQFGRSYLDVSGVVENVIKNQILGNSE